jgi:hypothetical protein
MVRKNTLSSIARDLRLEAERRLRLYRDFELAKQGGRALYLPRRGGPKIFAGRGLRRFLRLLSARRRRRSLRKHRNAEKRRRNRSSG